MKEKPIENGKGYEGSERIRLVEIGDTLETEEDELDAKYLTRVHFIKREKK